MVLGVYTDPAFLPLDACARIRRAMDAGVPEVAEVLADSIEQREEIRHATSIDIDDRVMREVEERLDAQRQVLSAFYGLALTEREGAGFMRYPDGGFYAAHRDRAVSSAWPDASRRRIALVVFLNGSRDVDPGGGFSGGILRLFLGESTEEIQPRAGMLVAFPADVLHEVTEVRGGVRDAIVDWYYGAP